MWDTDCDEYLCWRCRRKRIYRVGTLYFNKMIGSVSSFLLPFAKSIIEKAIAKIPDDAELGEKLIDICLLIIGKAVKMTKTEADDKLFEQVSAAIKAR